jgi:hypothetical protein
VSNVDLMMLFLLRLDPLVLGPPFPMLEAVNSQAELSKCIATRIEQEPEAPIQNGENRTIRFQKPDPLVLSGPTTVRHAAGFRRGASPPVK